MKKLYFVMLSLIVAATAFAADSYLPILKEGRNWRYLFRWGAGVMTGYDTYLAKGSKEIDGKVYTKIFKFGQVESSSELIVTDENDYYHLVREEDGKIYYRTNDIYPGIPELLLMDMSLTSADKLPMIILGGNADGNCIDTILYEETVKADTINVGGVVRKRVEGWIEGIGTSFTRNNVIWPKLSDAYSEVFLGCYDGDELICGPEAFGMAGIEELAPDSPTQDAPAEYYNLQGIRVTEPAAGNIYIRRQGSKVSKIKF